MKILTISAQKPDSTGSGIYLSELVKSFRKMGIENAVVCGIDKNDNPLWEKDVRFYPVHFRTEEIPFPVAGMSDLMPYESTRYKDMEAWMQDRFETVFMAKIEKAVAEFDPDFILCHHLYFLTALVREKFPERKVGAVCHGSDLRQFQKTRLQNERIRSNIQKLDRVFALQEHQKKTIADLYDLDLSKIEVIGTGYNSSVFYNKGYDRSKEEIRLIFAGKLCEKKGVFALLDALDAMNVDKEVSLYLAGGYSDEEEYQKIVSIARECKRKVVFLGKLSQKELTEEFNKAHIFVLPSFYEGLPLVIVEALSCGLKVVATDLPGVQEWINSNLSNHKISFVKPPKMHNVDDPDEEFLGEFVEDLTHSLEEAVKEYDGPVVCDTSSISWDGVAKKIVK